jgi:hypothetical protein
MGLGSYWRCGDGACRLRSESSTHQSLSARRIRRITWVCAWSGPRAVSLIWCRDNQSSRGLGTLTKRRPARDFTSISTRPPPCR